MIIQDQHYDYLVLQNGSIDHLKGDRKNWKVAYNARLNEIATNIQEWLPKNRSYKILDIGSGLGGIHIKLKQFNSKAISYLLDGERDPPEMKTHNQTFNNMFVAEEFLKKNGVELGGWFTPKVHPTGFKFDVVLSIQSWCFHYNPEVYIELVKTATEPGSRIIVDMRVDYKIWQHIMQEQFGSPTVIQEAKKSIRCVYFVK